MILTRNQSRGVSISVTRGSPFASLWPVWVFTSPLVDGKLIGKMYINPDSGWPKQVVRGVCAAMFVVVVCSTVLASSPMDATRSQMFEHGFTKLLAPTRSTQATFWRSKVGPASCSAFCFFSSVLALQIISSRRPPSLGASLSTARRKTKKRKDWGSAFCLFSHPLLFQACAVLSSGAYSCLGTVIISETIRR